MLITATVRCGDETVTVTGETKPKLFFGARMKYGTVGTIPQDYITGTALLGPMDCTRLFYSGENRHVHVGPSEGINVISWKENERPPVTFVNSLCPHDLVVCHHEPEADYGTGPDRGQLFQTAWRAEKDYVKALRPDVKFGMVGGGYMYKQSTAQGYSGLFIPPDADWYGLDNYRTGVTPGTTTESSVNRILPLTQLQEFLRWLSFVEPYGKPLAITEWGRGLTGDNAANAPRRVAALEADYLYLTNHPLFMMFMLWHVRGTQASKEWAFEDTASVNAVNAIPRHFS